MRSTFLRPLLAMSLIVACSFPAFAQRFRRGDQQAFRNAKSLRAQGEIVTVAPGLMQVRSEKANWVLQVQAKPERITLVGTADKSWLRPGMIVRFTASLDKNGTAQKPVSELFVFTPRPGYGLGIVRDESFAGDLTFGDKKRKPGPAAETYLVAGQLVKVQDDTITVAVGRQKVVAPLAEETSIKVDLLGDYSFARPGDKVAFRGKYLYPGQAVVDEIKITGAAPFSAPKPTRATRGKRRQPVFSKNTTVPRKDT